MGGERTVKTLLLVTLFALLLPALPLAGCGKAASRAGAVTVPELAGMSVQEAEEALFGAGLAVGAVSEVFTDAVVPGRVVSSSPEAGEEATEGSAVDLVVSKGPEMVPLGDLMGKPENDAIAALQAQGLQVTLERAYHESVAAGLVCAMDPSPGSAVVKGAVVRLTISMGSAYITCGTCGGKGKVTTSTTCPDCGGTGACYT